VTRLPGHSIIPGAADAVLHRQIVDVLTAEYENGAPPDFADGTPPGVIACAWGLYAQVHRHARAVIVLTEAGMDHEAHVHVRAALEHTVLLHWVIERGQPGVDAVLSNQAAQVDRSVKTAREAAMVLAPEIEQAMDATRTDEKKAAQAFRRVCEELNILDLYFIYGVESQFVHPSVLTINAYAGASGLTLTPQGDIHRGNFALLAPCLIWSGRSLDRLVPGQPKTLELNALAESLGAAAILPSWRPLPPPSRKGRRRGGIRKGK
jgi:hypothetical protein